AQDHRRDRAPDAGAALALVLLALDVLENLPRFLLVLGVEHVPDRQRGERGELLARLRILAEIHVHLAQLEAVEDVARLQGHGLLEVSLGVVPVALAQEAAPEQDGGGLALDPRQALDLAMSRRRLEESSLPSICFAMSTSSRPAFQRAW